MHQQIKSSLFLAAILAGTTLIAPQASVAQSAAPATPIQELSAGIVIPGQYIVVFKDEVSNPGSAARELARTHGLGLRSVYSSALKGFAAKVPDGRLNALRNDPRIKYIEADQTVRAFAQEKPTGISRIFAPGNSNISINGSDDYRVDVDVAVIDTGISNHPDLNTSSSRMTDCLTGVCVDGSATDGNGHGTHVSGTIAAIDNNSGVVGVAPGARLWGVRVLDNNGSGSNSGVIAGIDWVTAHSNPIKVSNMSLGGGNSTALCDAITRSVTAGVVHVVAAGNSNVDMANTSPANCTNAIAVSAIADYNGAAGGGGSATCSNYGSDESRASFSNFSASALRPLIAAPGVCIKSTWLNGAYNTISGTSMASPHVAGAAALLRASGVTAANIRSTLYAKGNAGWTDTSGDLIQEPLLDVSDTNTFKPALIAGAGNDILAPTGVAVSTPAASSTLIGSSQVSIFATDDKTAPSNLTVTWSVDNGSARSAVWNGTSYVATWDTTKETNGAHTIAARAVDLAGNSTASAGVNVTLNNTVVAKTVGLNNQQVGCSKSANDISIATTMVDSVNKLAVSGATVSVTIRNSGGSQWTGSATTGSNGTVNFRIRNAPRGTYTTDLTNVTSSLTWDQKDPTNTCTK